MFYYLGHESSWTISGVLSIEISGRNSGKRIAGHITNPFPQKKFNVPVSAAITGLELSHGQASDWHTDGQTDAGNDNTRWPNWPQVKIELFSRQRSNSSTFQGLWEPCTHFTRKHIQCGCFSSTTTHLPRKHIHSGLFCTARSESASENILASSFVTALRSFSSLLWNKEMLRNVKTYYSVSPIYRGWWGPSNGTAI